jgi:hypothetical protein
VVTKRPEDPGGGWPESCGGPVGELGQRRGGLYSYDWLQNLIGSDVHSTGRILPKFQTSLQGGDRLIRMARYAPCNPVALSESQRDLVLGHVNDTHAELAAGHQPARGRHGRGR